MSLIKMLSIGTNENRVEETVDIASAPVQVSVPMPIPAVAIDQEAIVQSILAALPKQSILSASILPEDKCVTKLTILKSKVQFLEIVNEVTGGEDKRTTNLKSEFKILYKTLKKHHESETLYKDFEDQGNTYQNQALDLNVMSQRKQKEYLQESNQAILDILKLLEEDKEKCNQFIEIHLKNMKAQNYVPVADLKKVHKKFFTELKDSSIADVVEDYCNSCSDSISTLRGDDILHWFGVCGLYNLGENY